MENDTFLLFTYGTLMKGERNQYLLDGARFIGEATTKPKYRLFSIRGNFHFPALIDGGEQTVKGEVYECAMSSLSGMDRMEGHPHFYCRQPIELETLVLRDVDNTTAHQRQAAVDACQGKEVIAYLFVDKEQLVNNYPEIKSGDWRKR